MSEKAEIKVFELTQKILENGEAYILGHTNKSKLELWFFRHLIFPINFLLKGSEEFFKPFMKWSIMSVLFILFGLFIIKNVQLTSELSSIVLSFCIYIPMALVMFSVPSTYAYYGVDSKKVDAVVKHIEDLNIQNTETIECILTNLESINSRIITRVSTYKWLVGASWGLFTLLLNQQINLVLKISPESWQSSLQNNVLGLSIFIIITIVALWIITSYKRASELLIKTLEFGLIEVKHKLDIAKNV
ncbi:MAG: hypothetical protein QNK15_00240 [Cycloclasticus sp.]|nr:hypothetical protein [Cycloclasticus sp.]